jgi:hypothetical protein
LLEEPAVHERVEQGIARGRIEPPQAPDLRLREVKTGDFQELAANDRQPVAYRCLHRAHLRSFTASAESRRRAVRHTCRLMIVVRHLCTPENAIRLPALIWSDLFDLLWKTGIADRFGVEIVRGC